MSDSQYNSFRDMAREIPAIAEVIAGGASTLLFGGLSIVEGIAAVVKQDVAAIPPTGILAVMAYAGYRLTQKGYDQLTSPDLNDISYGDH